MLGWGFALAGIFLGDKVAKLLASWNIRVKVIAAATLAIVMNSLNMHDTSLSGLFFGFAAGAVFLFDRLRFNAASGTLRQKAARYGLGLAGVLVLYLGIKLIAPGEGESLYALFRFIRYGLVGAWVSLGAPWLFLRLKLAATRPSET